ncbi:MAG: DNA/RNA non-specific endonuclease [Defluviicoccus sp.]|nr:DNA/RNA non-specific endonuclease [Defluviicoccus sp.]MDE0274363.1 DNA/RNA non-specific endonuclease [Defluviicoccus sp.]
MVTAQRRGLLLAIFMGAGLHAPTAGAADLVRVDYPGFTLWLDCAQRGAVLARYQLALDTGNIDTKHGFRLDEDHRDCQQASTSTYRRPKDAGDKYDRGHIVPANHLDDDEEAYRASYFMTNVVPQHRKLNRKGGAWRKTEDLIECWREEGPLEIWIGVLWGTDEANDHFVRSHGIATPDAFVKLVYRPGLDGEEGKAIAWRLSNRFIPDETLMEESVAPGKVEKEIGRVLNLPGVDKTRKANPADWRDATNCDP